MKNLKILLVLVFISTSSFSQEVNFRIDWHNLLYGSPVNKPSLNYKLGVSDYYNGTWTRLGMEIEQFKEIDYFKWSFCKIDQEFPINKNLSVLTGVSFAQIFRPKKLNYCTNALSYCFNLEITYKITNHFKFSIQATKERATDVSQIWRNSAYGGVIYCFNEK